jgi:hypothetical protein
VWFRTRWADHRCRAVVPLPPPCVHGGGDLVFGPLDVASIVSLFGRSNKHHRPEK